MKKRTSRDKHNVWRKIRAIPHVCCMVCFLDLFLLLAVLVEIKQNFCCGVVHLRIDHLSVSLCLFCDKVSWSLLDLLENCTVFYILNTLNPIDFENNLMKTMGKTVVNPFPNKPWFLCVCSTSLMKTLWEKEKLLMTSNFPFFHSVFYSFGEPSIIFIKFEIVVCKLFQFERV